MRAAVFFAFLFCAAAVVPSSLAYFQFQPYSAQGNCVTGSSGSDGSLLTVTGCDPLNAYQKFNPVSTPTGTVTRMSLGHTSGCNTMCVDVPSAAQGAGDGGRIVQTPCHIGTKTQYWTAVSQGGSANWWKNLVSARCLTAETGYMDQYACSPGAPHQVWTTGTPDASVGGSTLTPSILAVQFLLQCLGVPGGNGAPGAALNMGTLCDSNAFYQHFKLSTFTAQMWLMSDARNLCMDGGSTTNAVYQYTCSPGATNHQWIQTNFPVEGTSPGYFYMVSLLSGYCLTWSPTNPVNSAPCVQGNVNQQWIKAVVA